MDNKHGPLRTMIALRPHQYLMSATLQGRLKYPRVVPAVSPSCLTATRCRSPCLAIKLKYLRPSDFTLETLCVSHFTLKSRCLNYLTLKSLRPSDFTLKVSLPQLLYTEVLPLTPQQAHANFVLMNNKYGPFIPIVSDTMYLLIIFRNSTPPQYRQLYMSISNSKQ